MLKILKYFFCGQIRKLITKRNELRITVECQIVQSISLINRAFEPGPTGPIGVEPIEMKNDADHFLILFYFFLEKRFVFIFCI